MFSFITEKREFIVDEIDVTTVIGVINGHRRNYDMEIGNCGWADEPSKWFIMFNATDTQYGKIIDEMNKLGTFEMKVSPNFKKVQMYFERAH